MKSARLVLGFLLLGGLLLTQACGKKDRPYISTKPITAKVVDLKGERSGDDILLEGKISGVSEPEKDKTLAGLRVYVAPFPRENPPCADCPIEYKDYKDLGSEVIKGDGFTYRLKGRPADRIYFIRVRIIGPDGALGPPSNQVNIK